MTQSLPRWRAMFRRDSPDPLLPAVVGAVWLASIAAVAVLAPTSVRDWLTLGVAVAILVASYWRWPKPSLLLFAFALFFEGTISRWTSADLAYLDEFMVPAFVMLSLVRQRPWQKDLVKPGRDGALIVFLAMGVVSSVVAGVPLALWLTGLVLLIKVFAFLYVVTWHDFDVGDVRQIYPTALGVGIVVGSLSAIEFVAPVPFQELLNLNVLGRPRSGLPSLKSITGHPANFSWFMAFVGLFLFAGYVVFRRWWLLLGGALFSIATVLSARRRAILGMALGLLAGFLSSIRSSSRIVRARPWAVVGLTALLVGAFFVTSLMGLVELTTDEAGEGGNTARVALYQTAVAIARDDFPLGVGLGRYGSGLSRDPYSPVYHEYGLDTVRGMSVEFSDFIADAFWARVLGETGVIGFAALILFCAALAVELWRATRQSHAEPLIVAFVLGAWMVFVQALAETVASSMFESPPRVYLLFGATGIALSLARIHERAK